MSTLIDLSLHPNWTWSQCPDSNSSESCNDIFSIITVRKHMYVHVSDDSSKKHNQKQREWERAREREKERRSSEWEQASSAIEKRKKTPLSAWLVLIGLFFVRAIQAAVAAAASDWKSSKHATRKAPWKQSNQTKEKSSISERRNEKTSNKNMHHTLNSEHERTRERKEHRLRSHAMRFSRSNENEKEEKKQTEFHWFIIILLFFPIHVKNRREIHTINNCLCSVDWCTYTERYSSNYRTRMKRRERERKNKTKLE